jgi:hypothetical protein
MGKQTGKQIPVTFIAPSGRDQAVQRFLDEKMEELLTVVRANLSAVEAAAMLIPEAERDQWELVCDPWLPPGAQYYLRERDVDLPNV